ncbi:CHAT domain-containing protein [Aureispira anguillae]|uniref:CHAT domain-containing protein n=1 Tax=Aureispira anguillae TaxID=2864201 RepID=A0A915Y9D5_9BACT|nr:CHAT domain-containing tetratricopeptide repeat protein [Aureispira anguillae]BDS09368.1 CHAT domain-containing protein [Aureispira anguillae]
MQKIKMISFCLGIIGCFSWGLMAQNLEALSYAELDSIASLFLQKEAYKQAIPYMQIGEKRAKMEFGKQDSIYVEYLSNLGGLYYLATQYKKAESLYTEAKNIYAQFLGKDDLDYVFILNDFGRLYQSMGRYSQAQELFLEAKNICVNLNDDLEYANSLNNLATSYFMMGDYFQAKFFYLKVKKIYAKVLGRRDPLYSIILNNLALIYQDMYSYSQAEKLLLEVNQIHIEAGKKESLNYAIGLENLAELYEKMDSISKVERLLLEARDLYIKIVGKNHLSYAKNLNNLAAFYVNIKEYSKAEELAFYAKELYAKMVGEEHPLYAISLNTLGGVYYHTGRYQKGEELLLKMNKIDARTMGEKHPSYALGLSNLAVIYEKMDRLTTAFSYCIASMIANSDQLDSSCLTLDKLDEFDYYSKDVINGSIMLLLEILRAQYKKTGEKAKLKQHYQLAQAAIRLNEKFRNEFINEEDKLRILGSNKSNISEGIQAALQLEEPIYVQEAFSFAEQNKSILLADAIKGNRARVFGDLPDRLAEEELQLQKKLAELKKENYSVQTADEKARVNRELGELNLKIDSFLKSLKDKYPKYHALKYENITAKAQEIQSLLDEKSLMIEYFQTDTILYLFALSKDQVALYPISIHKDSLEKRIGTLRNALSNFIFNIEKKAVADEHYVENAHWLYQKIVAIALKDKSIKNLIVITDGALGHLPFEVFLTRAVKGEKDYRLMPYLLNDYTISYNYSATLWKDNLKEGKPNSNGEILAFGATYPKVDSNVLSFRLPYFLDLRLSLSQLPESEHEVNVLAQNFEGNFLIGKQANEQLFKEKALGYGIIHLAMHGRSNSRIPMLSSLAFTEDNNHRENNFLQAYEISQLELNANLVVLSACETGYGKFEQGNGIASLARSFMYAGAPSLIVSLWQVNDASTAVLMQSFYHYLAAGKTKDAALRQAKLDYIQSAKGDKAHPIFWSAFIQLGNTAPIAIASKSSSWKYILGISFSVFMILWAKNWLNQIEKK